ncbi:hypothetical protein GF312_16940, partial [Candidatus Poribacteria bacterium]|nr:hypothetical protein [Candidatus Poribacteria bacterium]
DLESYYFIVRTNSDMTQIVKTFLNKIKGSLPALFFGTTDEERGIYGNLERMFTFRKSDFEPFPVYSIPEFLVPDLEKAIRRELSKLLESDVFPHYVKTVCAALAFFYGRTSGGKGDAQSFRNFIDHLVNEEDYDGLLTAESVIKAFNVDEADRDAIKTSIDKQIYAVEELRALLSNLALAFQSSIDNGSDKWMMGFLRKSEKFIDISPDNYVNLLLRGTQLGYHLFSEQNKSNSFLCRICNTTQASIEDSYVTIGLNAFRFNNQSARQRSEKICIRCALYSYLSQKLLGTEMISAAGKLPQAPKTYNLIFHYGRHDSNGIEQLVQKIDLIWNLVRQHKDADQLRREVNSKVRDLKKKIVEAKNEGTKQKYEKEMTQKESEVQKAQEEVKNIEKQILIAYPPFMQDSQASFSPSESPSLDTIANMQLSESKVERHVLGLGMQGYRMILFVLPQIRPPYDTKEHDFAQRRFSNSRVTVSAVLSFLHQLCGCDGPFYYQSLPTLTADAFQTDRFYIRDEPINVEQAQREYEAITQLAWRLIWQQGSKGFVRKVILAEKLLEDPLGTFSAVMRDSPILGKKEGNYKLLKSEYRQDWKAQDLTEYARFIQKLSTIQEANPMALKVDREKLDTFCRQLFQVIDDFGLLPNQLSAKPNEFEKYPRLLLGSIRRYSDVEAGFREWESRVLRASPYRKEKMYLELEKLRQWMVENQDIFAERSNIQHLYTSLYSRIFNYVYPRRILANAYCVKKCGSQDALDEESLTQEFTDIIEDAVKKVQETYKNEWDVIVADAKRNLLANRAYYEKVIRGSEVSTSEEEELTNYETEGENNE